MTRSTPQMITHWHICSPGKTIFLRFMLARLISAHQVVLVYAASNSYLFYRGQVYSRSTSCFQDLPTRPQRCHIWALIDLDDQAQEPAIHTSFNIWPILAASPNPVRWKSWGKQYGAAVLGMPLWNMEELMEGYAFNLFSLSTTEPGYVIQSRFVADCPLPL